MKYELKHGIFCKPKEITVSSWFDTWIEQYKEGTCKASTIQTYKQSFDNYIKPILGKKKITDIQPQMMQKLINDLHKKDFSKSRINIIYVIYAECLSRPREISWLSIILRKLWYFPNSEEYRKVRKGLWPWRNKRSS